MLVLCVQYLADRIVLTCLPERTSVNSVCEVSFHSMVFFFFHCSTGNIYKYKGNYLFRRTSHASI